MCIVKYHEKKIRKVSKIYRKKIEKGAIIEQTLKKFPDTLEDALDKEDKKCLMLYQTLCASKMNVEDIKLKRWQEEVIGFIESPSERTIFWVVGQHGNEGKTFLQKYIGELYGARRVIKLEINAKKCDIAYVIAQQKLTCKDIFLFNMLRSDPCAHYGILEKNISKRLIAPSFS